MTITKSDGTQIDKTEEEANRLPFLSDFAKKIGVDVDTLREWTKVHPNFSASYKKAKKLQTEFLLHNGVRGNYNAAFTIFTLKNVSRWRDEDDLNFSDKQEITGNNAGPLEFYSNIKHKNEPEPEPETEDNNGQSS